MNRTEFHRILVANRGEIASRIIRSIHELNKVAVVVYAHNDRGLPFVQEADEAFPLGSGDLSQTYLNTELILKIAKDARADAIHPGYGFLAENAEFARACEESGIQFIGPSARAISLMGHKSKAREFASEKGIPVLEGDTGELESLLEKRLQFPYPLLIKPSAGGGGKGMRIVQSADDFEQKAREASREAQNYFGSGELYVERYLQESRHMEVQVIADHHGNRAHLFERECSLQRRYQKIIEEAPSGFISRETRERITRAALDLIREMGYTNAGTVEFLMDPEQNFFFMEMNTRIQVEHPVTELITGIDLVKEQISIAEGNPLSFSQDEVSILGHAIEARIYAENPSRDFLPSTGTLTAFDLPRGNGVRSDVGYSTGNQVEPWYDPMLAKLIVTGNKREETREKMIHALKQTYIAGPSTNRDFLITLLQSGYFKDNKIHTRLIDREIKTLLSSMDLERARLSEDVLLAAASFIALHPGSGNTGSSGHVPSPWHQIGRWRILQSISMKSEQETHFIQYGFRQGSEEMWLKTEKQESHVSLESRKGHLYRLRINGQLLKVWGITDSSEILLDVDGHRYRFRRLDVLDRRFFRKDSRQKQQAKGEISAPLNGRIVEIHVKEGDRVAEGVPLVVIESMKMENKMLSEQEAIVKQIKVSSGQQVRTNQILLTLDPV